MLLGPLTIGFKSEIFMFKNLSFNLVFLTLQGFYLDCPKTIGFKSEIYTNKKKKIVLGFDRKCTKLLMPIKYKTLVLLH